MKVTLCTFTRVGLESELGSDLAAAVRTALCHYTAKLGSGRPPIALPHFVLSSGRRKGERPIELSVSPDVEATLKSEAARQGIDLDLLVTHSVLVYLAELHFLAAPARLV
jgi:hypothetical protein